MQINSLLHIKGSDVATIVPGASLLDGARELARHQIGALVVSDDGQSINGIVSERDIARAVAEGGPDALELKVADVMTVEVTTCAPQDTVLDLMGVMTEHRIRHLPVLDNGDLVGIISIGDVVKQVVDELQTETQTLHEYLNSGR